MAQIYVNPLTPNSCSILSSEVLPTTCAFTGCDTATKFVRKSRDLKEGASHGFEFLYYISWGIFNQQMIAVAEDFLKCTQIMVFIHSVNFVSSFHRFTRQHIKSTYLQCCILYQAPFLENFNLNTLGRSWI